MSNTDVRCMRLNTPGRPRLQMPGLLGVGCMEWLRVLVVLEEKVASSSSLRSEVD